MASLPHDEQGEFSLLILAIDDNTILSLFAERINQYHFYNTEFAEIWRALKEMYADLGIADELRLRSYTKLANPDDVLFKAGEKWDQPSPGTEEYWAQRLESAHFRRQMIKAAREMHRTAINPDYGDDEALLLGKASSIMDGLASEVSGGDIVTTAHVELVAERYIQHLEEESDEIDFQPVPTNISEINRLTGGGFNRGEHVIIGGRPGMGKTSFALWNVAFEAAANGIPTVFFSLEMSEQQLVNRLLSAMTDIPGTLIKNKKLDLVQWQKLKTAQKNLKDAPLYIVDRPYGLNEIIGQSKRMKMKLGIGLIVIDYIQLLLRDYSDWALATAGVVSGLTRLAKETKTSLVSLSQFRRESEKNADKRPGLGDIFGGDKGAQDASVVLGIHRESRYNDEAPEDRGEILILKNRHGPESVAVDVGWDGKETRYYEI